MTLISTKIWKPPERSLSYGVYTWGYDEENSLLLRNLKVNYCDYTIPPLCWTGWILVTCSQSTFYLSIFNKTSVYY